MKIASDIIEQISNAPLAHIWKLNENGYADMVGKLEFFNPAYSIKDRNAPAMIKVAEKAGNIKPDIIIIKPTSGNRGQ